MQSSLNTNTSLKLFLYNETVQVNYFCQELIRIVAMFCNLIGVATHSLRSPGLNDDIIVWINTVNY